jgi:hypothetical protein
MSAFAGSMRPSGFPNVPSSKHRVLWESIDLINDRIASDRLKVTGGWLVRSVYLRGSQDGSCAIDQVFIADPGHEWEI